MMNDKKYNKTSRLDSYYIIASSLADRPSKEYRRKLRLAILKRIVSQIEDGQFRLHDIDPNRLYLLHNSVRHEYQSPQDISGYNWGYMTSGDIGAGNTEAR